MDLILDIKVLIGCVDIKVWHRLMLIDDAFYCYAYSKNGINMFANNFTVYKDDCTKILNVYHSINDKPAVASKSIEKWYYIGKIHRDNDLPAIIRANGSTCWYNMNKLHRDNDLPAIINEDKKYWYYEGKLHRENNLPAVMHNNGYNIWYIDGVFYQHNYILQ